MKKEDTPITNFNPLEEGKGGLYPEEPPFFTLKERERLFVRRVKMFGGYVTVKRNYKTYSGELKDRYVVHIPTKRVLDLKTKDPTNSVMFDCPFCRYRYKKNGYPYKRAKPQHHIHNAQGFDCNAFQMRAKHCRGISYSGHSPNDDISFGITNYEYDLINMEKRKPLNYLGKYKQEENEVILDHDVFPNEKDISPESELSYITSFFSQKDLP